MRCLGLEFRSGLVEIDLLCSKSQRLSIPGGDQLHVEGGSVKGYGHVQVLYSENEVVEMINRESHPATLIAWLESFEEHLPTSIAGVLRLRAISRPLCDRSARRFAQDDGFVGGEKHPVGYAENTKRSKKSQALGMTKRGELVLHLGSVARIDAVEEN